MSPTAIYRLSRIVKRYGERTVLQIEELSIRQGEVLAILGPSGAGKSTLLRLLNFLERPDAGTIAYRSAEWDGAADMPLALRHEVTTVFQRPLLLDASVRANVAYGLRLRNLRDGGRVDAVLERVGLGGLAGAPARTLSGGELQRAALARAIVLRPQVLLLDEPTANLDPHNVGLIEGAVQELRAAHGTTVVIVTHNIFQARRVADRAGLLLEGRLIEVDEVELIFTAPREPATAAFIAGDMIY